MSLFREYTIHCCSALYLFTLLRLTEVGRVATYQTSLILPGGKIVLYFRDVKNRTHQYSRVRWESRALDSREYISRIYYSTWVSSKYFKFFF